ncbi:MAG TPA: M14-type cytosolic carboxypeptidase [Bryobacteraceae bacterium]
MLHFRFSILFLAIAAALPGRVAVRSDFESGSIGRVAVISPDHLRCSVKGQVDQNGRNRQASWYYFELDGAAGHEITIDLTDLPGEYNYRPGNLAINSKTRPFLSYDRKTWTPLPDSAVTWDDKGPILRIRFAPERSPVWIAHVPPYTTKDLSRLLHEVAGNPAVKTAEIGRSVRGRPLYQVTVTNAAVPEKNKKVVWLIARQHAWESGTSWVVDGALASLAGPNASNARLLETVLFHFLPMCDPDGVAGGGVRFNVNGYDVNRNWDAVDPKLMPEIAAAHRTILAWLDGGHRIDLLMNLHNDNTDYLLGPLAAAGPAYERTIERIASLLRQHTVFEGKQPRDLPVGVIEHGRMDTSQKLFHDRKIAVVLLEQNVQTNTRLGRPLNSQDYRRFGAQLIEALAAGVTVLPQ